MNGINAMKKIRWTIIIIILVSGLGWWYIAYSQNHHLATITTDVTKHVTVSQEVTIPVVISTNNETINAAEIYLTFDPAKVEVKSVSKDGSLFQIWITDEPKFSNQLGTISFAGGLPTPGFKGRGRVGTVSLVAKHSGLAVLTFDKKTRILKNDGLGTAIPLKLDPIIIQAK